MELLNILLSIIGFIGAISVGQLISIAKSLNEIKTSLEVLTTRHDYLENRVKDLENYKHFKDRTNTK